MKIAQHIVVKGRVQGVYFRANTQKQALRLQVVGYVLNLPNGDVEAVACGDGDAVQQLIHWCHQGPLLAKVSEVLVEPYRGNETFDAFDIR